jgi:hypothetical protein
VEVHDGEPLDQEDLEEVPSSQGEPPLSPSTAGFAKPGPLLRWDLFASRTHPGTFVWQTKDLRPPKRFYTNNTHPVHGRFEVQKNHFRIAGLRRRRKGRVGFDIAKGGPPGRATTAARGCNTPSRDTGNIGGLLSRSE